MTVPFLRFNQYCSAFWRHFPSLSDQIGLNTALFSLDCWFVHTRKILETSKFDKWYKNIFRILLQKNLEYRPNDLYIFIILLTSPTAFSSFLLQFCLFWTKFSEHDYILDLNSNALNMHRSKFSRDMSMQQEVWLWNVLCFVYW